MKLRRVLLKPEVCAKKHPVPPQSRLLPSPSSPPWPPWQPQLCMRASLSLWPPAPLVNRCIPTRCKPSECVSQDWTLQPLSPTL
ncbi:hypothetical protein AAY473_030510 [Plecturocebus cupreus]